MAGLLRVKPEPEKGGEMPELKLEDSVQIIRGPENGLSGKIDLIESDGEGNALYNVRFSSPYRGRTHAVGLLKEALKKA